MKKKVIVILIIFLLCAQPLTAFASFGGMFGNEQDSRFTPTHPSPNATAPQFTPPANTGRSAPVPDSFYNDSQPTQGQGQASVITSEMGGGAVSAAIADTGNLIGGVMPFTPPATVLAVTGLFGAVPLLSVTPISLVLDRDDPRSAENSPQPGVTAGADGTASAGSAGSAGALGPAGSLQPGEDSSGGLTEAYRLMLGMYEQTFEPGRSFITSVPNGGITQDAVYLEFPANMKVTAEFNGRAINPSARVRVTETGSYAFRVTSPNFAAAGESVGIFTFRILPPNTAGREDAGSGTVSRPLVEEFFTVSSNNGATLIEYVFSNHKRFYANAANGETLNRPAYFILPPNVSCELRRNGAVIAFDNNKNYTDPGSYVMTVRAPAVITTGRRAIILHTVIRFNIAEGADEPLSLGAQLADMLPWGQDGDADGDTGVPESFTDNLAQISEGEGYRQYFSNGMSFWGSVENGGASDIPVSFDIPGDIFYDLTHDGNAEHYISGGEISEPGSYRLDLYILPQSIDMPIFRASFDFTVSDLAESPQTQETEDAPEADVPVTPSGGNIPEQSFSGSSFRHMTPADIYFTSNIPNGMAGRVAAQFSIPETAARVMTLDGEEIPFLGDEEISAPGDYELTVTNPVTGEDFIFAFTILPQFTQEAAAFSPPMGYRIESVSKDGEAYVFSSSGAEFTSDGDYVIHLTGSTGYPPFTVDFTLDTVPPRLMLEGVEDGKAVSGEVMLISDDTSAAITVLLNGNDIGYRGGSLKKNGTYTVTVTDRAGNFSAYEFVIPYKMNITAVLLIVLLAMLLGGGALYLFRLRRNVKLEL